MRRSKKGFTLAELLVVVAIIAILVAVSIPIFAAQREKAETATCDANRRALKAEMTHDYLTGEFAAMTEAFNKIYTDNRDDTEYICPKEGTYTWESTGDDSGRIKCSVHQGNNSGGGDGGDTGGDSEPEDEHLPGTDIPIVPSYWPNESMYGDDPLEKHEVSPGGIFKFGDSYYVVTVKLTTVDKKAAIGGPEALKGGIDSGEVIKITGKIIEGKKNDYRIEGVVRGDIYHATDGNYYVFNTGWNEAPPWFLASWYKLPSK